MPGTPSCSSVALLGCTHHSEHSSSPSLHVFSQGPPDFSISTSRRSHFCLFENLTTWLTRLPAVSLTEIILSQHLPAQKMGIWMKRKHLLIYLWFIQIIYLERAFPKLYHRATSSLNSNDLVSLSLPSSSSRAGCWLPLCPQYQIYFFCSPWPLIHIIPLLCSIQLYTQQITIVTD